MFASSARFARIKRALEDPDQTNIEKNEESERSCNDEKEIKEEDIVE